MEVEREIGMGGGKSEVKGEEESQGTKIQVPSK